MAIISKAKIYNMALSKVGAAGNIEDTDDGSSEADECNIWYDFSLLQSLEAHDWHFARTRLTLATHSDDPPSGVWDFRYQYPSDCVAFRRISNPLGDQKLPVPFDIEVNAKAMCAAKTVDNITTKKGENKSTFVRLKV